MESLKGKIKIGQTIYIKSSSNYKEGQRDIKIATISKIGSKYFQIMESYKGYNEFSLETGLMKTNTNYRYKAYLTIKEIEDLEEHLILSRKIKREFDSFGNSKYSLEQLREIAKIINLQ